MKYIAETDTVGMCRVVQDVHSYPVQGLEAKGLSVSVSSGPIFKLSETNLDPRPRKSNVIFVIAINHPELIPKLTPTP